MALLFGRADYAFRYFRRIGASFEEPDMMTAEKVDEQGIKSRISDPFFTKTTSVLAREKGKVDWHGRISGFAGWYIMV